ncbi:MAG: hypothetical protein AAGF47_09580 [Planctomycetota bacterium]
MTDRPDPSQTGGSLMDGIEFEKRKTVDADWSKAKRLVVGSLAAVLALGAVGAGGYFAWQNRPVSLPTTADQALAAIKSGRVDRLPPDRQRQYYAEARPLLDQIPREQWENDLSEADREAYRQARRGAFDETLRELARGNITPQDMFASFRRPRPQQNEDAQDGENQRANAERQNRGPGSTRFQSMLQNSFQNGDAQRNGLMGEMFTMRRAVRQAEGGSGGGRRRGGG